jgi:hypothetical protein
VNYINVYIIMLDEQKIPELFYFKSSKSDKIFKIKRSAAKLSELFETMLYNNEHDASNEANAIVLSVISHPDPTDLRYVFCINVDTLLKYIEEYLNLYADDLTAAEYPCKIITTGLPSQVLKPADLAFIRKYLNERINDLDQQSATFNQNTLQNTSQKNTQIKTPSAPIQTPNDAELNDLTHTGYADFTMEKFTTDNNYNKKITLKLLNELLAQAAGFLGIVSLQNKILAYIAVMVWNISIVDIDKTATANYFVQLQPPDDPPNCFQAVGAMVGGKAPNV